MINNTFRNDFFFIFRGVIFTPPRSHSVFPLSALPPSAVFRCFLFPFVPCSSASHLVNGKKRAACHKCVAAMAGFQRWLVYIDGHAK